MIDSSHKTEERRSGSNSIFLGINTMLASFLIRPSQLSELQVIDLPLIVLLVLIGMFISWDWLKVTASYKQLNSINCSFKANVILVKENVLPKVFMLFYCIYFFTIVIIILQHFKF